jgi:hypothetical protein
LRRAQKLDCPIVFIIREPEYCIASLVARFGKSNIDLLFRDYEELYSHCLRIDKGLMVYKFDKLIANPEDFIRDVSEKFSFPLDEERLKYAIRDSKAYIRAWTTVNGNPNSMGLPSRSRKKEVLPIVDSVRMHVAYTLAKQCYLDLERLTDAGHDS